MKDTSPERVRPSGRVEESLFASDEDANPERPQGAEGSLFALRLLPAPSLNYQPLDLSPLQCAVPRNRSVTPLECAVPKTAPATPLECAVTKKGGGGGGTFPQACQNGSVERSTFPPERITPTLGALPSDRRGNSNFPTPPGRSSGATATAEDGSMMIFMRSQTVRIAATISSSETSRIPSAGFFTIVKGTGASDPRRPPAIMLVCSSVSRRPL